MEKVKEDIVCDLVLAIAATFMIYGIAMMEAFCFGPTLVLPNRACIFFCACDILLIVFVQRATDAKFHTLLSACEKIPGRWSYAVVAAIYITYSLSLLLPDIGVRYTLSETAFHLFLLYRCAKAICESNEPVAYIDACSCIPMSSIVIFTLNENRTFSLITYVFGAICFSIAILAINNNSRFLALRNRLSDFINRHLHLCLRVSNTLSLLYLVMTVVTGLFILFLPVVRYYFESALQTMRPSLISGCMLLVCSIQCANDEFFKKYPF